MQSNPRMYIVSLTKVITSEEKRLVNQAKFKIQLFHIISSDLVQYSKLMFKVNMYSDYKLYIKKLKSKKKIVAYKE